MKLFIPIIALAISFTSFAQTTDDQQQTLRDKLYVQVISAYNSQDWSTIVDLAKRIEAAGEPLEELTITYAEALLNTGQQQQGVDALAPYIQANPNDYQAYKVLGELYQDLGQNDLALAAFMKSVELRPAYVWPYVSMARIYGSEHPSEAMTCYNMAISLFLKAERPDVAISLGAEAMNIDNSNIQLLMLMGNALSQAGMEQNALSFYAEAISQASNKSDYDMNDVIEAYYSIAMIYYKQGDYLKADNFIAPLFSGDALTRSDAAVQMQSYCLAAAIQEKLGNAAASLEYQDRAAALDPDGWHAYYTSLLAR